MAEQYVGVRALNRSANIRVNQAFTVYSVKVDATGGNWKLTLTNQTDGNSDTTADVAYNVSTSNLKTALANLTTAPDLTTGDVTVTGGPGDAGGTTPYVISFYGAAGDQNFVVTGGQGSSPLTGGASKATVTAVGRKVKLTTTTDVVIDLARPSNQRALARHSAIGQYIITAANNATGATSLPTNS